MYPAVHLLAQTVTGAPLGKAGPEFKWRKLAGSAANTNTKVLSVSTGRLNASNVSQLLAGCQMFVFAII
jgi:hypothetical protein